MTDEELLDAVIGMWEPCRPICDVCNKPVERFERELIDYEAQEKFTARCHGETEVVFIPDYLRLGGYRIEMGRAFTTKKLEA